VELRQVGVRDETAILGGIGTCGRPCCCATFPPSFNSINVKMAKQQGLSLNPQNISGCCGRLKCCLQYEAEFYRNLAPQQKNQAGDESDDEEQNERPDRKTSHEQKKTKKGLPGNLPQSPESAFEDAEPEIPDSQEEYPAFTSENEQEEE